MTGGEALQAGEPTVHSPPVTHPPTIPILEYLAGGDPQDRPGEGKDTLGGGGIGGILFLSSSSRRRRPGHPFLLLPARVRAR